MTDLPVSIRYQFNQRFNVSATAAFDWCTAFDPSDPALMGDMDAKREIKRVADGSVLLKDTFQTPSDIIEKQKLVSFFPIQLRWTSTHLSGPNRHSQFLYVITPIGKDASELDFTALHIEHGDVADAKALAERLCREDSAAWVRLAKAMETELNE